MSEVTVADLLRFLERQDPDMVVRLYDYQLGETEEIFEYWVDRERGYVIIQ